MKALHLKNAKGNGGLMMYKIIIKKKAKKFIDKLLQNEKSRVVSAIEKLPNGEDIKKIRGGGMRIY